MRNIKIRHIGIVTSDVKKSLSFYSLLGFNVFKKQKESGRFVESILLLKGVEVETIKLKNKNEQMIEILNYITPSNSGYRKYINDIGISHIAFSVEELNQLYFNLLNYKVDFLSEPKISEDKKHLVCFCKDPDGNFIELVEKIK